MNRNNYLMYLGINIVLKGQHNLAQGLEIGERIVRALTFIKEKFIFRTKEMIAISPQMMSCNSLCGFHYMDLRFAPIRKLNSVRRKIFALFNEFSRTVFVLHPLPRAAFRIVPPETLPWAMIFWPFRPEKYSL